MDSAKRIPKVCALTMALGLGVAVASGHGVASALPSSDGTSSTGPGAPSGGTATSPSDSAPSTGSTPTGTSRTATDTDSAEATEGTEDTSTEETGTEETGTEETSTEETGTEETGTEETSPDETSPEDAGTDAADQTVTPPAPEATAPAVAEVAPSQGSGRPDSEASQTPAVAESKASSAIRPATSSVDASAEEPPTGVVAQLAPSVAATSAAATPISAARIAASEVPEAAVVAPMDPFTSLVSGFVALVTAPFAAGGFLSSTGSTPTGPFGSLLELVFLAQRRVQSFFFNQSPIAQSVQLVQTGDGVVTGRIVVADPDGDPVVFTVDQMPANGTVTIDQQGFYTYTPNAAFAAVGGTDAFTVSVSDDAAGFHFHGLPDILTLGGLLNGVLGLPPRNFDTKVNVDVMLAPPVDPPGPRVFAINAAGELFNFTPSAPQTILRRVAISGLASGETIVGIDFRPANGLLYGLSSAGKLYTLDQTTGVATLASTLGADATDPTAPFTALAGGATFGIDFNPVPDRLRVIEDTGNLRINVDTGATFTDSDLVPTGDYFAAAYTNSFPMPPNTALYAVDATANTLVRIGTVPAVAGACPGATGNPNCGVVTPVGSLNVDVSNIGGFDIAGPDNSVVLAAFQPNAGGASSLYRINLSTGAATLVGSIGTAASGPVTGLAIRA